MRSHRKLNAVRVRGLSKVAIHCFFAVIVVQAMALTAKSRTVIRRAELRRWPLVCSKTCSFLAKTYNSGHFRL